MYFGDDSNDTGRLWFFFHTGDRREATTEAAVSEAASEASEALDSEGAKADGSYTVGIIQLIENGAFNDMREGFIEELQAKGYTEDKLTVDYKCAQGDATNLQTIAQSMADGDYDLVCTIATPPHRQWSILRPIHRLYLSLFQHL